MSISITSLMKRFFRPATKLKPIRNPAPRKPSAHLVLEVLEDRNVPTTLSANQVAQAAFGAGFHGGALVDAVAVADAESSFKLDAINYNRNASGAVVSIDRGLWQINSIHDAEYGLNDQLLLSSAPYNAAAADKIFAAASGWTPWVTFNNGAFASYLQIARNAAQTADSTVIGGIGDRVSVTSQVNVRLTPGGTLVRTANAGATGSVVDGPYVSPVGTGSYRYVWWKLHLDDGKGDGWVAEDYLSRTQATVSVPTSLYLYASSNPVNVGQTVSLYAYCYASTGSAAPAGNVSIFDNNNYVNTVSFSSTWSGGAYATWSSSSLTAGSHTLKAVYNPSGNFQGSSTTVSETVNSVQVPTTTYLYTSSNPVNVGQSVTLYNYVYASTGSAAPAGNVSIYDNGNYLTTVGFSSTWSGGAYATWSTSSLTAGTHTLKAVYNSSGNFQGSSTTVSETVNSVQVPTTTYLYTSSNPVNVGQSVTLYNYVYASTGSAAPAGNVSIYDNGNYLTTVGFSSTWSGGAYATWSTSSLTAGTHTLKAVYNSSGNFQGSSTTVSETVNAPVVWPNITSINPSYPWPTGTSQWVTIYGSGFQPGATVTLRDVSLGTVYYNRTIYSQGSTWLSLYVNFGTNFDLWSVEITNPGNLSSGQFFFWV